MNGRELLTWQNLQDLVLKFQQPHGYCDYLDNAVTWNTAYEFSEETFNVGSNTSPWHFFSRCFVRFFLPAAPHFQEQALSATPTSSSPQNPIRQVGSCEKGINFSQQPGVALGV